MTKVLCIAVKWLEQLQRLAIQQKNLIALEKIELERDFGERVTENGQLGRCRTLVDGCSMWPHAQTRAHSDFGHQSADQAVGRIRIRGGVKVTRCHDLREQARNVIRRANPGTNNGRDKQNKFDENPQIGWVVAG